MEVGTEWEAFQESQDPVLRDQLVNKHIRLVHHVARQLLRGSRMEAEFDELVSAGTIGLINAVENFDASRGLAFSTFAAPRIRGAILDDLRRRDHVPRSVRRKQRDIAGTRDRLAATLDRLPTDDEMAREMGIEVQKLWRWQREAEHAGRVSLDRPTETRSGHGATPEELLSPGDGDDMEEALNREEEVELLRDAILDLKEQERLVLSLYYFEELKLHEIATIMGVTESRISQIRSKAIANLRARLAHLRETV